MAIVIIRTAMIYFALLLAMRLMGKRQLGEMELSEFVVASLIADLAAHPLQDVGIPMTNGLVPVLTLFCFEILIAGVSLKSIRLRALGRDTAWLRDELKKKGYADAKGIYLMTVNQKGQSYIAEKEAAT